ncbi:MAG: beta-lactamase family protein [Verrucomicrobiota bacterium]|nr:beta-lactamase family protein [Verrucomicrobiota bacterium]
MFRTFLITLGLALGGQVRGEEAPLDLPALLEKIRAKHNLPALAAAGMRDGKLLASGAVGTRRLEGKEAVTLEDKWHVGSCTKSMTATLAALFVEQGKLKWETRVEEVFPHWKAKLHPDWREATLEQLLTHRAGAPGDPPPELWRAAWQQRGTPRAQREEFALGVLTRAPEAKPGAKFIYSNQGYAIAGAMLEQLGGKPWEELMRTLLFEPLGMKSAGFGAPGSKARVDHPWGHSAKGSDPQAPGPKADNPPAIGPAGTVHCSIEDFARYAALHARGEKEGGLGLPAAAFEKLHTPHPNGEYAFGWGAVKRGWAGGFALTHAGSNTLWFAVVWVAPEKNAAFVAATNIAGESATRGCDDAVAALIRQHLPK